MFCAYIDKKYIFGLALSNIEVNWFRCNGHTGIYEELLLEFRVIQDGYFYRNHKTYLFVQSLTLASQGDHLKLYTNYRAIVNYPFYIKV